MDSEVATAYHEAAHAVAAYFLRLRVRSATIVDDGENLGYVVQYAPPESFQPDVETSPATLARLLAQITVLLAGQEAENRLAGRQLTMKEAGTTQDHRSAVACAEWICGGTDQIEALLEWRRLVARDLIALRWTFIDAVAKALLAQKTLSRRTLRDVIQREIQGIIDRQRTAHSAQVAMPIAK